MDQAKNRNKKRRTNFDEENSSKQGRGKSSKGNRFNKQRRGGGRDLESKKMKSPTPAKPGDSSRQQITLRKRVDPETAKYFTEIARLFESNEVDLEERSAICGNALEESRGKEVELATDMIISHTLQILVEGCDLEQLCAFLRSCAKDFPSIAMDKFGSHVAEAALSSLAKHLQDEGSISMIEDTLNKLCQMVVTDTIRIMCCSYGSHVLRSLLCLCKGVPVDISKEFHVTKPSAILSERLNFASAQQSGHNTENFQHCFTAVFNFLVREMLKCAKDEIATLRVDKYSSFVLQTILKLLVGDDRELLHAILTIIGCEENDTAEGMFIEAERKKHVIALLEDTSFSHLFEVVIKVAPASVYDKFLNELFKGSLFEISSLHCGNFVVQALVSSAKTKDEVALIWEELGSKLEELLEIGKPGVVASVLATCQRLQINIHECCQALAAAVSSKSESTSCIVPHLLFLESYFRQKSHWTWPFGDKMHTLGCLMLQTVFRCSKKFIQSYSTSISSMDIDHILETAKDAGGCRVLESFFCSEASPKHKFEVITKLQGNFAELAMHPSSSFTVEKCFTASDVPLKETIASELVAVQSDLSKTKHGPYLLKKLDIDGFASRPEQWKRSQASKETIYKEFQATFGSNSRHEVQSEPSQKPSNKRKRNNGRASDKTDVLDVSNSISSLGSEFPGLDVSMAKMGLIADKRGIKRERPSSDTATAKDFGKNTFLRNGRKTTPFVRNPGKRKSSASELANLAGKQKLSSGDVHKLFKSTALNAIKQSQKVKKPFLRNHGK
ncbi:uncharacterized protein A4U43_C07F36740 [Asparagus officinalis]|uniref:PUM-HD domain-containing protein n=1 Tax=Asparagus officinalis TaxID=4686 RepID=A0A5P1EI28_ASPOF|nr:pumilio homolog 23 isoform X1 [Asparagus officinalis]XP_020274156.1 pumilio homolog 23 isoform X2 [Asparagus officinalis]ONK65403.1 uncharacterized protein A4U43_C07F36740 [Asparagus officinalis]